MKELSSRRDLCPPANGRWEESEVFSHLNYSDLGTWGADQLGLGIQSGQDPSTHSCVYLFMQLQQRKLETGLARGWETEPDTAYASVRLSLVLDAGLPEVCLCTGPRPYWLQNTGGEGCTGEGLWFQTLTQLAGLLLLVSRRFPALSNRRFSIGAASPDVLKSIAISFNSSDSFAWRKLWTDHLWDVGLEEVMSL